jgi:hypothetical protein
MSNVSKVRVVLKKLWQQQEIGLVSKKKCKKCGGDLPSESKGVSDGNGFGNKVINIT